MARPVAVVTGAARGIGLETARRLSATHRVALLDLDAEGAERAAAGLGDAVWARCDITDPDSVATAIDEVVAECGGIDVCISNAGIAAAGALRHLDPDVLAAVAERQPHRQLARDPRLPAARRRAPRLRARRRLAGRDRRAAGHRRLRRLQGRARAAAQRPAHRGPPPRRRRRRGLLLLDRHRHGARRREPAIPASRPCARACAARPARRCRSAMPPTRSSRGVQRRSRRVVAPGFVGALFRLRGLLPELIDREAVKSGAGRRPLHRRDGGRARRLRRRPAPGQQASDAAARSAGR